MFEQEASTLYNLLITVYNKKPTSVNAKRW